MVTIEQGRSPLRGKALEDDGSRPERQRRFSTIATTTAKVVVIWATWFASLQVAAADVVNSVTALPLSVKAVYENSCHADNWIGNKRRMDGSTSAIFVDGTAVFLLVCGDAASSVPYVAIVMETSGEAREPSLSWTFHGKALDDGGLGNARFGSKPDTIVSTGHVSATCEPTYTHRWIGGRFQLVNLNKSGCRRGEF